MTDLIEILNRNGIKCGPSGNEVATQCPSCRKEALGSPLGTLNLDPVLRRGECSACKEVRGLDDWLELLGIKSTAQSQEKYIPIVQAANKKEAKSSFDIIPVGQILSKDYGPQKWLVENLMPEASITAIAGAPGSFKTWLTLEIGKCVSSGADFLGKFKVETGHVLFVDKENHFRHLQDRLKQIGITDSQPVSYLDQQNLDFFIEKDDKFDALMKEVENLRIKLVVFDSLVRIHSGDENEARSIALVMSKFRQITNLGASVIFVHHHRKEPANRKKTGNSMRGSSDILAGVDSLLIVEKLPNEPCITVEQAKLRQAEAVEPFSIKIESNKTERTMKFSYLGSYDPTKLMTDEIIAAIVVILKEHGEKSRKDLIDLLSEEYSPSQIDLALKKAVAAEGAVIGLRIGPSNKHLYSLKENTAL